MYTLDKHLKKTTFCYTLVTMFCALFAGVYEAFSHNVFSYYMLYAFAFPLVFGVLPFLLLSLSGKRKYPRPAAASLWHLGVAFLTVGSLMCGVLEIYGTANSLTTIYWIAGSILLAAGAMLFLIKKNNRSVLDP